MLKGIDPVLCPELLKVLAEMGHGDEIAVVDANFTAASLGLGKPVIRLAGIGLRRACDAVLSVFPLDGAVEQPIAYMQVSGQPDGYLTPLQEECIAMFAQLAVADAQQCEALERFAFYARVKQTHAIVQTGEMQTYANVIFKKGVISDARWAPSC